jgi:hypothetical protein
MTTANKPTGLDLLRAPFPAHQISKLPKPTKKQTEDVKADYKKGIRCKECGAWHHPDVVHLDYVGHAALTDRLLDTDQNWNWEPMATKDGAPTLDQNGGLWIKLTVCGLSRIGYGHSDGKTGGDAIKEAIGDALRNAAMRFGAALDLWHKGDLHLEESEAPKAEVKKTTPKVEPKKDSPLAASNVLDEIVKKFAGLRVTKKEIEDRYAKSLDELSGDEIDELRTIYKSVKASKDKETFFPPRSK